MHVCTLSVPLHVTQVFQASLLAYSIVHSSVVIIVSLVMSVVKQYSSLMVTSARNKDQKLVGRFLKIRRIFYRLLTAVPLNLYGKFGQPKWILFGQMM